MSTLHSATTASREGLTRVTAPTPPAAVSLSQRERAPGLSSVLRCPLPPMQGASPDSLRQYYRVNSVPQWRIISPQTPVSTTTTPVSGGVISVQQSSGVSTPISVTTPTSSLAQVSALTTPILSQGQSFATTITLAKMFALFSLNLSAPARVQLYSTASAQITDSGRSVSVPITLGIENAIIADFDLEMPSELAWTCSPIVFGFNNDTPQSPSIYVTVTNPVPSTNAITVSFSYVSMEN